MTTIKLNKDGLIPAIIQDAATQNVLMLGYMNKPAFEQTIATGLVTFYSRSRQEIWVKGSTSGNYLRLISWRADCDRDALLIQVTPDGPVCHTGTISCFGETTPHYLETVGKLVKVVDERFLQPLEGSYIQSLISQGLPKIAQKVGEESVELVIEAMRNEPGLFLEEAADLLFHYLVLLRAKETDLRSVMELLEKRMK